MASHEGSRERALDNFDAKEERGEGRELGPRLASWPSGGEGESGTAVTMGLEASGALARAAEGHDMRHATSLAGREGVGG
jgi:hypothetical protein